MRLLWASRTNRPKKLTHIRMTEPRKEEERMSLMPIPRHSALKHITLRRALHLSIQRNYLSEEMFWEPGFTSLTESHFCFTVSPSLGLPVFWLVLLFVWLFGGGGFCCCVLFGWLTGFPDLWIWDAQVRRHFQDWFLCYRFTFIGITSVLVGAFVCLAFWGGWFLLLCVVWLVDWFSRFMNMGCTSTSSFPRLSPSSRWAQQWSKKNC